MGGKMKFSVEKLLKERLIAKLPASLEMAKDSLGAGKGWLGEAKKNFENELYRSCILTSYLGVFHCARGVLFRDGFRDKSHFGVARYLENVYVESGKMDEKFIELLDYFRELRHEDQYRTNFSANEEDARNALKMAKELMDEFEKLILNGVVGDEG